MGFRQWVLCVFKGERPMWAGIIKEDFLQEVGLELGHEVVLDGKELYR